MLFSSPSPGIRERLQVPTSSGAGVTVFLSMYHQFKTTPPTTPQIYTGSLQPPETGETYLDMRNWNFGVVWVNGHNLGRYWDVGADRGLYPQHLAKPGH